MTNQQLTVVHIIALLNLEAASSEITYFESFCLWTDSMKTRYKSPGGTGVLELSDEVTVQALFEEIRRKTGIRDFIVKYGPPMAMQTLDFSQRDAIAKSLGLHGETLTVVPNEALIDESPQTASQVRHPGPRDSNQVHPNTDPQDIVVPWPQREGTLRRFKLPNDDRC